MGGNLLFCIFALRSVGDAVFTALPISLFGVQMTAGALFNLLVLGTTATLMLTRRIYAIALAAWAPFLAISALSILWAPSMSEGVRWLFALTTVACFFVLPSLADPGYRKRMSLLEAIMLSSIAPVVFGLIGLITQVGAGERLRSVFLHANSFSFYLTLIAGLIMFLRVSKTVNLSSWARNWSVPYMILLTGLNAFTGCRAGWVGLVFILAAYAFLTDRRFLVAIAALPLLLLVPAVQDRLSELDRGRVYTGEMTEEGINSFAWRQLMWESALADSAEDRALGKGVGAFGPNSVRFFPLANPGQDYGHRGVGSHSVYVLTIYETGLVGFACYLGIFAAVFLRLVRLYEFDRAGVTVIGAIVVARLLFDYSDNMLDYGDFNLYFWGLLGIVFVRWESLRLAASQVQPSVSQKKGRAWVWRGAAGASAPVPVRRDFA